MNRALGWVALLAGCIACGRAQNAPPQGSGAASPRAPAVLVAGGDAPGAKAVSAPAAQPPASAPGNPLSSSGDDHEIGAPKTFDNLAVFLVTSKSQEDIGAIMSLDTALAKKTALVHEIGADGHGDSAQVNALVIENKGSVPVYVLAGTIVKGGKQDRQIGSDFIVGANQTVPVDAYCVEHGRWTAERDGVATAGQFGVAGVLTDSHVRAAGQYEKNQSAVWSKVAEVNAANHKEAASGTLMATVDSGDIVAQRTALAGKIDGYLKSLQPNDPVVGFAYAVDGNVRSVRWFANHKIFELFRETLVSTAAMDAITARAAAMASGKPASPAPPVAAQSVSKFVKDIQDADVTEQRSTPALNDIRVRASKAGYGSSTMLKPPAAQPTAKPKSVSSDFTSR
jgi:hypothetical protein